MKLSAQANELRGVSNKLVGRYSEIAEGNQQTILIAIVISTLVVLASVGGVYGFMTKAFVGRIGTLSELMETLANDKKEPEIAYAFDSDEIGGIA